MIKTTFSKLTFILIFVSFTYSVKAQYSTGIGLRYGTESQVGLSLLQFFSDRNQSAADFIISAPHSGVRGNAFYEIHLRNHSEKIEMSGIGFFFGAGGHVGRYKTIDWEKSGTDPIDKENVVAVGIDGIAGIEWKLPKIPLLLSLDVHPFLDLNYMKQQPEIVELGLSLKYLF